MTNGTGEDLAPSELTLLRMIVWVAVLLLLLGDSLACGDGATGPVDAPRPTTVTVIPPTATLMALGATVPLATEVRDQNGRAMSGVTVTWTSSSAQVASVDAAGVVTAVANGAATITATTGSATGSAEVTVAQVVGAVAVSSAGDTLVQGDTLRFAAEGTDANGHTVAAAEFSWTSSDTNVVTVDETGLATGVRPGRADIVATSSGVAGGAGLQVVAPLATTLAITPDSVAFTAVGDTVRLTAQVHDQIGRLMSDAAVAWSTQNTTVATVDQEGLVTAVGDGSATIAALAGAAAGSADVRVRRLARMVTVLPPADTMFQGSRLQMTAEATDANGHPVTVAEFEWASTNPSVAVVDHRGLVKGVAEGVTTIIASHGGTQGRSEISVVVHPDRAALVALYQATNGPNWGRNAQWLTEHPLVNWHGVGTNEEGRVTELRLNNNNLTGRIPPELAQLDKLETLVLRSNDLTGTIPSELSSLVSLRELILFHNDLTGRIPPELGKLANLEALDLDNNDLTGPIPPELGRLSNVILLRVWRNELTGEIPPELGQLAKLEVLVLAENALRGQIPKELGELGNLKKLGLTKNRFSGSIPSELGKLVSLEDLRLDSNDLTGSIPSELGALAKLKILELSNNDLTGRIPPELQGLASMTYASLGPNSLSGPIPSQLGNLDNLEFLNLRFNKLTGSIPPALAALDKLTNLWLHDNELTGPIPPELAELENLKLLLLQRNALTGPIPPALGSFANLEYLELAENNLTGPIPPELGKLDDLVTLVVADNDMTGAVPEEVGLLANLLTLNLSGNARMSGALPASLTSLRSLSWLFAAGTDLCAPSDAAFQVWLDGVRKRRVQGCGATEARAYLTQAVQSRKFPVPLVAGQDALLRVFVTSGRPTREGIPDVRARFFLNGVETHVVNIPAKATPIPNAVDEGSLSKSANESIPGSIIQPGLEMVIEVDPHGNLDPGLGVEKRIPMTGRMTIDVREMPTFNLTVVPFLWSPKPDSLVLDITRAMENDSQNHGLLGQTRTLLPVGDFLLTAHEPVLTSYNTANRLIQQTDLIRVMEGGQGHYLGTMTGEFEGVDGLAYPYGRTTFSKTDRGDRSEYVIAHELGHNMGLQHTPGCGAAFADHTFPHPNGVIGAWGYDFDAERLVSPDTGDLMSYCHRDEWISEFHRTNALRYRLADEGSSADVVTAPVRSLLLWGGVDDFGVPFLEPSFVVDAPPTMPAEGGEYRLTGSGADGDALFSFSFGMQEIADRDGGRSFAFALPVEPGWAGRLSTITLSGPDRSVTLDEASDRPMLILRDPVTGQVRGILSGPAAQAEVQLDTAALPANPRLETLYSRGIPDAGAWRR